MVPSRMDNLPRLPEDPPGWHERETTGAGYPLMGSSPAERADSQRRAARIKEQAMRSHPFQPSGHDQRFCGFMGPAAVLRGSGGVSWAMRTECGYPADCHPEAGEAGSSVLMVTSQGTLPSGLCGDRGQHVPHEHDSPTLGTFWCTADQREREPGRSEWLRRGHGAEADGGSRE